MVNCTTDLFFYSAPNCVMKHGLCLWDIFYKSIIRMIWFTKTNISADIRSKVDTYWRINNVFDIITVTTRNQNVETPTEVDT
jgi:hypothetical protein